MSLSSVEDTAIGILNKMPTRDADSVRKTLRTVLPLFPDLAESVTEYQLEQAARRIEHNLSITAADASKIQHLDFEEWLPAKRGVMEMWYYTRYRRWLESERSRARAVLGVLDRDTDKIVGFLQDPERSGNWKRRGLVVGHVQSGKTENYSGVICKAADYGYRFIVVLTGMQEDLRVQTVERIEEAFIGLNSEKGKSGETTIGVGRYGLDRRPPSLTTRDDDFRINQSRLPVSLQSVKEPLIVVTKKNSRILGNLISWLKDKSFESGGTISSTALLLIDDEADNASINTAAVTTKPTSINRLIRELLAMFDRNAYVGYTATPFANIFIDPEPAEGAEEDLFPRHFICSLDAPTNYVGASRIFPSDGDLHYCLKHVSDHSKIIPEVHKADYDLQILPASLYQAVRTFVLARALRIVRGQGAAHSSMLINVTRFTDLQTKVTGLINDYLNQLRSACQGHSALPLDQALLDKDLIDLHATWMEIYDGKVPETWGDVQPLLIQSISPIEVRKINSKSPDNLAYRQHKATGLHVIAVGGLALSRGFTLEGLVVTYFLRNSQMYDTLLQMGRWFGYRNGFEDLCRIYMTEEAISWYAHISEACDELREDFRQMERMNREPEDFGHKVRTHPVSLIVTARNKMRTGRIVRHYTQLGNRLIETTAIKPDQASIQSNRATLAKLVRKLDTLAQPTFPSGLGHVWRGMPAALVREFVSGFKNHDDMSPSTQSAPVIRYIDARAKDEAPLWDVCLFSLGADSGTAAVRYETCDVRPQTRSATVKTARKGDDYVKISGESSRVASRGHEKAGMTDDEIALAVQEFKRDNPGKQMSDRGYRHLRKRPLLMLHVLNLKSEDDPEFALQNVVAWGISFPSTKIVDSEVEYLVNTTWWEENFARDIEEYEEAEAASYE
ncbi:Z1 domain-containing protein [Andreprevotia chitinilytica]|uniref:Z1 domain-containing protein n=1 Tax=Andreprevotia chitinilytica TaxID=396808 RepID=UPI00068A4655|nr:Z1 domain-containing protein [Andreprevotia chitinilytica]